MAIPKVPENNVATSTPLPDLKSVPTSSVRAAGEAFNPMQDLQRSQLATQQAGLPSGGFTPPVKVPETTDAATLGKASTPNVPPVGSATTPDAFVDSIGKSLETFNQAQQATQAVKQPLEAERSSLSKRFEQALSGITGRGQAQLEAERAAGVPEQQKQLQELNLQIAQRKAEYDKAIAALPGQGRGITTGIIAGQTAREQRMSAVELGSLASVAQAVQGNLALAQQTADKTIKLEFADRQQEVDNLKTLLDLNYDNLSRAEKKQADQLNFILQERQNAIEQAKADRSAVLNLSAQAAQNRADNATLTKMSQAKTPEEALAVGGQFLAEQAKRDTQVVEVGNRKVLIDSQTGETISDLGIADVGKGASSSGRGSAGGSVSIPTPSGGSTNVSTRASSVYENPALLSNYTPTERGKILDELSASGADMSRFAVNNVTAGQRDQIAQYDDLVRQGKEAETVLTTTELDTGPIASRIKAAKALVGGAEDFTQYRSIIDNMGSALLKLRSGAAVTPQEFERIKGFIPSVNDDEKTASKKIKSFYSELDTARANYIKRSTQSSQQIIDSAVEKDQTNLRSKYNY